MKEQSETVSNVLVPGSVDNGISEEFDGTTKKNVTVTNTGTVPAYIRVRLVTYRVGDNGNHIGGVAEIPDFAPGDGWVKYGDCYYYTKPVAPGKQPETPLIGSDGIALKVYDDEKGDKQVIEVLSETIQATPPAAVAEAWGVTIEGGRVTPAT